MTDANWRGAVKVLMVVGTIFSVLGVLSLITAKTLAFAQLPPKIDSLRVAHDTQTAILREQLQLQRCLVIYGRSGCVALAQRTDP